MKNTKAKKKSFIKILLSAVAIFLAAILVIVGSYVAYVFIAYHRIGNMPIEVSHVGIDSRAETGTEYKTVSFNVGFGAYEADYGFFMDGGHESWAWSKERLDTNLKNISAFLAAQSPDICFIQEIDSDATRTYHVDERVYLTNSLTGKDYVYVPNYDSPFLFYPLYQPHGASKSGIMTYCSFNVKEAERIELPVENGLTKILDLDRCYSKARVLTDNNKELVLYTFHLSAYTTDGTIATEQLNIILKDMEEEYKKGNYVVGGGDFNKDLLGDSSVYFGKTDKEINWAQPIPEGTFDDYHLNLVAPLDTENPVPSARNADSAYHEGQFVITIDGFIISDNVTLISSAVLDTGFAYSDHNPVEMRFILNP